jgi:hypothetical protein
MKDLMVWMISFGCMHGNIRCVLLMPLSLHPFHKSSAANDMDGGNHYWSIAPNQVIGIKNIILEIDIEYNAQEISPENPIYLYKSMMQDRNASHTS